MTGMKGCKLKYCITDLKSYMKTNLLTILALSLSTTLSFICSYFMNVTLNNAEQYMALVGVLFVDGFFGVWAGTKREGFKTYKALKVLKSLFFWIILLTTILSIESAYIGAGWLSETNDVLKTILNKIDQHKNINPED